MRKSDLVTIIADKTGIPKVDVLITIEAFFSEIKTTVVEGEGIFLRGFGTFYPKFRKAKIGRNIKRGNVAFPIPAQYIAGFKPGKEFSKDVKTKCKKPLK